MSREKEYERSLLGALVNDSSVYDEIPLNPEDFNFKEHRTIFETIGRMKKEGAPVDLVTLAHTIDTAAVPVSYIAALPTVTGSVEFYVREILDASIARRLKKLPLLLEDLMKTGDVYEAIEGLEKFIHTVGDRRESNIYQVKDLLNDAIARIEKACTRDKSTLSGIPTGFARLDELTDGWQREEVIVIGARPSIGKTAIMLYMMSVAAASGVIVGFLSLEMSRMLIVNRLLSALGRLELLSIRSGKMKPSDFHNLLDGAGKLNTLPLLIDDTPNIHMRDMKATARKMYRQGARILFIDYLTLIRDGNKGMPKHERIGEVMHELKQMAREMCIPIVIASQLNRDAENRKPTLADLKASGDIEQDADVVLLLHRERQGEDLLLMLEKQRNGPCDEIKTIFNRESTSFIDTTYRS